MNFSFDIKIQKTTVVMYLYTHATIFSFHFMHRLGCSIISLAEFW